MKFKRFYKKKVYCIWLSYLALAALNEALPVYHYLASYEAHYKSIQTLTFGIRELLSEDQRTTLLKNVGETDEKVSQISDGAVDQSIYQSINQFLIR